MDRSRATVVVRTTTNFKPPYIMGVWADLKINQRLSIQYAIDSRVGYHNLVLCCVLIDLMSLVFEKGISTSITNYQE